MRLAELVRTRRISTLGLMMTRISIFALAAVATAMMLTPLEAATPIQQVMSGQGYWRMHVETQIVGASRSKTVRDVEQCYNLRAPQRQPAPPSDSTCTQMDFHSSVSNIKLDVECDTARNGHVSLHSSASTRDHGRTATLQTHFSAQNINVTGVGPAAVKVDSRGAYLGACPAGSVAANLFQPKQTIGHYTDAERMVLQQTSHSH